MKRYHGPQVPQYICSFVSFRVLRDSSETLICHLRFEAALFQSCVSTIDLLCSISSSKATTKIEDSNASLDVVQRSQVCVSHLRSYISVIFQFLDLFIRVNINN